MEGYGFDVVERHLIGRRNRETYNPRLIFFRKRLGTPPLVRPKQVDRSPDRDLDHPRDRIRNLFPPTLRLGELNQAVRNRILRVAVYRSLVEVACAETAAEAMSDFPQLLCVQLICFDTTTDVSLACRHYLIVTPSTEILVRHLPHPVSNFAQDTDGDPIAPS